MHVWLRCLVLPELQELNVSIFLWMSFDIQELYLFLFKEKRNKKSHKSQTKAQEILIS